MCRGTGTNALHESASRRKEAEGRGWLLRLFSFAGQLEKQVGTREVVMVSPEKTLVGSRSVIA